MISYRPLFLHSIFSRFFLQLLAFLALFVSVLQAAPSTIYVQASEGSFNQQALKALLQESIKEYEICFCGTPENTLKQAALHQGFAFCALHNTTIAGRYVYPTLAALQTFRIARLQALYSLKIEMALLRHRDGKELPLTHIASHPAALQQITLWKEHHPTLQEIWIPEGSAEAARLLTDGQLSLSTAVVGPKALAELYPALVIVAEGIQDSADNTTTFILFEPEERQTPVSPSVVLEELSSWRIL